MRSNGLYVVVAILVVAVGAIGFYVYHEENKPGVELKLNDDGISVQKN
jgi:hypothetical protein